MAEKYTGKKVLYVIASITAIISQVLASFGIVSLIAADYMQNLITADEMVWYTVSFVGEDAKSNLLSDMTLWVIICEIVFFVSLGIMLYLAGKFKKNPDGTIYLNWIDKIWSEVQIIFVIGMPAIVGCSMIPMLYIFPQETWFKDYFTPVRENHFVWGISNNVITILMVLASAVCIFIFDLMVVSIAKKIKAKEFFQKSLIGIIVRKIKITGKNISRGLVVDKKLMSKYVIILTVMILLAMTWVGVIIDIIFIIVYLPKWINNFGKVRDGVKEVKGGNLTYKIPVDEDENGVKTEWDQLAKDINDISEASNIAVQNELKNQRLKTDLITNVSHDLKTPLTSMVSYIDLIKKEGLDGPNSEEYFRIVDEKTQKLKRLTEDLFEAAKASSGNIDCEINDINLLEFVNQTIGEMEEQLKEKNIEMIVKNTAESQMVKADGQLLWRIVSNLLENIRKYALPGSRSYIDILDYDEGHIALEIKNISKEMLNISAEELMERFKRGDESRNTEGSGLGLSISKDLAKIMKGDFNIKIDGDLFKATVVLEKA